MFKRLSLLLLVITSFIAIIPAQAVEVNDLYQARIAIQSQTNRDRPAALKQALAAVLLKVGGGKSVLKHSILKKSLNNHQKYLTQYRYKYQTLPVENSAKTHNQRNEKQLYIVASFNEAKINQLFQLANLPLWGSLRPQILLWLIDEQGLSRRIMSNSTDSLIPSIVKDFSEQRGLPILMPLMDLTDAVELKISDIWGRFEQPIRAASLRYAAEAIVVMRISNSSLKAMSVQHNENNESNSFETVNCGLLCAQPQPKQQSYVLDWSLITAKQTFSQQYHGEQRHALLQQGLNDITEVIYQHYALLTTDEDKFVIEVANIDSMQSYVDVVKFLTDLSAVKAVTLLQAQGQSRHFQLQLRGSVQTFLASLTLNKQLEQYIDPLADMNNDTNQLSSLIFYWGAK